VLHVVPLDPDTFDADALLAVCRDQMPRYMVPRRVVTSAAFPRTASGKIDRKAVTAGEPATVP
jgi:acyl-CoA synthetase (AMP-forming)/AMP-acid ligase II